MPLLGNFVRKAIPTAFVLGWVLGAFFGMALLAVVSRHSDKVRMVDVAGLRCEEEK